jgi:hypothetical protein
MSIKEVHVLIGHQKQWSSPLWIWLAPERLNDHFAPFFPRPSHPKTKKTQAKYKLQCWF